MHNPHKVLRKLILVALLVLIGALIGGVWWISRGVITDPAPPPPRPTLSPVSASEVDQLDRAIDRMLRESDDGDPFFIHATDNALTTYFIRHFEAYPGDVPIKGLRIRFHPDQIEIWFTLEGTAYINGDYYICATADVQDGRLLLQLDRVLIGPVELSDSWRRELAETLTETIEEMPLQLEFEHFSLEEGSITLSGRVLENPYVGVMLFW